MVWSDDQEESPPRPMTTVVQDIGSSSSSQEQSELARRDLRSALLNLDAGSEMQMFCDDVVVRMPDNSVGSL